jgi:imidazolonepropionase
MKVFTGIGELVTNDPMHPDGDKSPLGVVHDAAIAVDGERVAWVGRGNHSPDADEVRDLGGRTVIPGFVDSHTHLVFAGDRCTEFTARMAGKPYTAGGIARTVAATRAASDTELRAGTHRLRDERAAGGTTTVEIKSGYGLSVDAETRLLTTAGEFTAETTFLGAHVVPAEYAERRDDYVSLVCGPMLQRCAPYARWVDVFCDRGAFDVDEAAAVLRAGMAAGLLPRLHAAQLAPSAATRLGVELGAASVDHCNHLEAADVDALAWSETVATLLPTVDFAGRTAYPDARRLLDAGVTLALATDCNPGSSFTTSMAFVIALAVRELRLTAQEALWAATAGGARALRRDDVGALRAGARADFAVLDAPSHHYLAYRPGVPLVLQTWQRGRRIFGR